VFSALLLAALAGCATGGVVMLAEIAGGEKIRVPLVRGGAEMTNEGGVQINTASFTLNADKKIVYEFAFTESRRRLLRSVRVEDVSDAAAFTLVEDAPPELSSTGQWRGEAAPIGSGDPRLGWLATISNTVRVFRFTLTFSDGQKLVLHQGALYPAPIKAAVRQAFGQNY
jgi:hypothetical protein